MLGHLSRKAPAAVVLAAGLCLTACSGNGGTSASASPSASGSAAADGGTGGVMSSPGPSSANPTATSGAAGTGGSTGGSTGGTGGSTGGGTAAGGTAATCRTSDLAFSWVSGGQAAAGGGADQKAAVVGLRNTSGHACAMRGYPGADLVNSGTQWSLVRQSAQVRTVTLAPGASARFTITYLPEAGSDSGAFRATTVVITPPNQRSSFDLPWKWGAVQLQDGATHPGTYVGPVHS